MADEFHRRRWELYGVPPDEFTAARNALAKELKASGDKDGAAEVAKLRRPSVGAWALNQVARSQPKLIEAALDAGSRLRAASDAAAEGDASGLRDATAAERAAAQAVAKAARPHLGARADALVPALLSTLRVAALDGDVAEGLRDGMLTTDYEQAGFGFGLDTDAPASPRRTTKPASKKKAARPKLAAVPDRPEPDPEQAAREKAERAEARAAERQRKKDLAAAERAASRLEREAIRLAKEADDAEADAVAAREAADTMAERAAAARQAAEALA
jgi:hypothetical protein